jgi:predicted metalloenzyme YecM
MNDLKNIIGNYDLFLSKLLSQFEKLNIDPNDIVELDHIAYRVETRNRYNEMKQKLKGFATYLGEAKVRQRPIASFKLFKPIKYDKYTIPCIELPSPSDHHNYPESLEHAEFVVKGSLRDFQKKYKHLNFIEKLNNPTNPELKLKFKGFQIKFHTRSLLEIRNSNKRKKE